MTDRSAQQMVEWLATHSYGRLLAWLATRLGDVAAAADALSDAFAIALQRWDIDGVPQKPEAWLLQVARNRRIDVLRRAETRQASELANWQAQMSRLATDESMDEIPDERLKLLFVCAHPAIDPAVRTPLMLQAVLGIDAARIASAFLVSPAAMSQRLVRAKFKIRAAGIPFLVPEEAEWNERVRYVLDAIYSAFTAGWESTLEDSTSHRGLVGEAIALGRTLVELMPTEAEAHGLLALMLHCEARRDARFTAGGAFVPLDEQAPARWDLSLIHEAEHHLRTASAMKQLGRYQLEAAIQSIHADRIGTGQIDWQEILLLYEGLTRIEPSIGALVGRAVALAEAGDPLGGYQALEGIPGDRTKDYQPYWAACGHVLTLLGRTNDAKRAWSRAASLTDDPRLRSYLLGRIQTLE